MTSATSQKYRIELVDLTDPLLFNGAKSLHIEAFSFDETKAARQLAHNAIEYPGGARFLATFYGNRMVAINGFIRHKLRSREGECVAYQSCSSATSRDFRGKGLFVELIEKAKQLLSDDGTFIIGFPNDNSTPIFLRKLGFRCVPIVNFDAPSIAIPFIARNLESRLGKSQELTFRPDDLEIYPWNGKHRTPNRIRVDAGVYGAWGYVEEKRYIRGMCNIKIFHIEGLGLPRENSRLTPASVSTFSRIKAVDHPALRAVFRPWRTRPAPDLFIYYPLRDNGHDSHFLVYSGLLDVL